MTGMIMDAVLMLLLVAALGYGVRLEKKLSQLRAGQLAFAGAVTELNAACTRAENALSSLRASGEEADLLHDRIIKARALKTDLEALVARGAHRPLPPLHGEGRLERSESRGGETPDSIGTPTIPTRAPASPSPSLPIKGRENSAGTATPNPDDRAFRMAALAERIQGLKSPTTPAAAGAGNVDAILHALTANQSAKQSLNRAKASLADDDLFAA
ncbi:DUF6468 domain-containing protein [Brevundimonas bacteroides]|uniref:DUF6468 domain-containing protein n=1 Tax=Brevundimonas bacteroides TaxID=74311 RepID=UPI000496DDF9|nr:DUF6468 domain-containing protein [Brevundimonas bacteroides]